MTKKKDLKKRVRARQRKTGESYTTALAHLRRPGIPQAPGATAEARSAGLHCEAVVSHGLRALGNLSPLFLLFCSLIEALAPEAAGPLLRGEPAPRRIPLMRDLIDARRFLADVRAGRRGISADRRILAFEYRGHTIVAAISAFGDRTPLVQLGLLDDAGAGWPPGLALLGIGG